MTCGKLLRYLRDASDVTKDCGAAEVAFHYSSAVVVVYAAVMLVTALR
jgi:hypothetical protein